MLLLNKEDLLLSIFEEKMGVLLEGLQRALEGILDPLDRVRAFARYHFRQVEENSALAEVLQVEMRLSNKFIKDYRPERLWAYLQVFEEIVEKGRDLGQIRSDVDPFVASWSFFGALDELSVQWILVRRRGRRRNFDMERAADQVAELFVRGLSVSDHLNSLDTQSTASEMEGS